MWLLKNKVLEVENKNAQSTSLFSQNGNQRQSKIIRLRHRSFKKDNFGRERESYMK